MLNKITLYLMSMKGFEVLKEIISNNFEDAIEQVIVAKDGNVQNDYSQEIENLCVNNKIKYFHRNERFEVNAKYSLAISWRWLINNSESQLIVLHDSLLPKYRGFAPLVNMLINGEKTIGVTALFANKEYDCGDIIEQSSTEISYPLKIEDAINIISKNYSEIVVNLLLNIKKGIILKGKIQNEKDATYSLWRDEEDYLIDWNQSSIYIENFINAVGFPYNGASTFIGKEKYRILEAEICDDVVIENRTPGKIIFIKDFLPVIVCGTGLLKLTKVINCHTKENALPFKNFRIRLKNTHENSF